MITGDTQASWLLVTGFACVQLHGALQVAARGLQEEARLFLRGSDGGHKAAHGVLGAPCRLLHPVWHA